MRSSSLTSSPRAALMRPGALAHLREGLRVDRAARLGSERQVERQELGFGQHLVGRLHPFCPELAEALLGDERVVRHDSHAEAERAPGDLLADSAEAEHAERFSLQLDPAVGGALPASLLQCSMRLRNVPRGVRRAGRSCAPLRRRLSTPGALATTIPGASPPRRRRCRPPRPRARITFSRPARSISSAVNFVAERMTIAS